MASTRRVLSTGAARAAQCPHPSVRKRESPTARRRRRASFARAGRAEDSSAACPEIRRGQPTLAGSDHDQPIRSRPTKADRPGACFPSAQRGRPSAPIRACANESLPPRAEGAARPFSRLQRAQRLSTAQAITSATSDAAREATAIASAGALPTAGAKLIERIASRTPTPAGAARATKPPTVASA